MAAIPPRTRSDAAIRDDVLRELEWDPKISSRNIGAAVQDGAVTLSGSATSYWEKDAAEKAVKRLLGVKAVKNEIEVHPAAMRSDSEITEAATREIQNHVSLPGDRIELTVRDAWVTLAGSVDWQYQKAQAESTIKRIKGVVGVVNALTVKPPVEPLELQKRIEDALKRSAGVDSSEISVRVHGSTVLLEGSVRSWAERQEAERAAWSGPGVAKVDNQITVAP